jgi:riboflavin transporter FmnP
MFINFPIHDNWSKSNMYIKLTSLPLVLNTVIVELVHCYFVLFVDEIIAVSTKE